MTNRKFYKYDKDGNRTEVEKLSPEQLEPELAAMPGDLITKDEADEERIHELDAPHIRAALADEWDKKQLEEKKPDEKNLLNEKWGIKPGTAAPLNRERVAAARFRVMREIINTAVNYAATGEPGKGMKHLKKRRHLWFDKGDNAGAYCWRDGNPPADSDRPKHMRGYDLHLDALNPPREVVDELKKHGIHLQDAIDKLSRTKQIVDVELVEQ